MNDSHNPINTFDSPASMKSVSNTSMRTARTLGAGKKV